MIPQSLPAVFDAQMCRTCGGRCCQGHPGVWVDPQRFFASYFTGHIPTRAELETDLPLFGLVLRTIDGIPLPSPAFDDDGCNFRTVDGCCQPVEKRPCQCLALQPDIETLMQGEMCCSMPDGFRTGQARERWMRFWERSGTA
jgi:hypothetical protein